MIPLAVGIAGIAITVGLQSIATSIILRKLRSIAQASSREWEKKHRVLILGIVASCLAVKHYIDMVLWAFAYWAFDVRQEFDEFESALYFSSVTYTGLGYGDIVLTGSWRLMCGLQAMNGILLFGWSAALLFLIVQRLLIVEQHEDQLKSERN